MCSCGVPLLASFRGMRHDPHIGIVPWHAVIEQFVLGETATVFRTIGPMGNGIKHNGRNVVMVDGGQLLYLALFDDEYPVHVEAFLAAVEIVKLLIAPMTVLTRGEVVADHDDQAFGIKFD